MAERAASAIDHSRTSEPQGTYGTIRSMSIRPIIFSVNCYIATILTMFIAFSLDLKSPGWAMTTVYLTSQPLSGVLRAKAVYRAIGTFIGGSDGRHRSKSS